MKFLTEINENATYLVEGEGANKKHFFKGLFLEFDSFNRNKRKYSSELHDPVVEKYIKEKVNDNRAFGELDHPDGPTINLKNVSHIVKEMHKEGSNWHGKAEITNTPAGNIVKGLFESEANLGVSSRGLGSLKEIKDGYEVGPDYRLITVNDVVSDPSAHGAFVKGILESVEYFFDENSGTVLPESAMKLKKKLRSMNLKEIEEKKTKIFEKFLCSLSHIN